MSTIKERMQPPTEYRPIKAIPNPGSSVLVTGEQLRRQIVPLAESLVPRLRELDNPVLLVLAKGGNVFGEQFAIELNSSDPDLQFEMARVRYKSRIEVSDDSPNEPFFDESEGEFPNVEGRNVVIIDDVADSLHTGTIVARDVEEAGGVVTDMIVAVEKYPVDEFKGIVRKHFFRGVPIHALVQSPALWLYGYGMDNGNDITEDEDRALEDIHVNWPWETEHWPGMVEEYKRRYEQYLTK